jgi:hypothetical protein
MKILLTFAMLVGAVALYGCASGGSGESRASVAVNPQAAQGQGMDPDGHLIVYSAFDTCPDFYPATPYHRAYSDYRILRPDGGLLEKVHNESADIFGNPAIVKLTPGKYQIVVRAPGGGLVTVPVSIAPGQTTTLRLDSGLPLANGTADSGAARPTRL